jgi:hypothetical protein
LPSLQEIAERADVPLEGVVRTLTGSPVSEHIAARVRQAVDDLGAPHPNILDGRSLLVSRQEPSRGEPVDEGASRPPAGDVVPQAADDSVEGAHEQLLAAFAQAATDLETTLPQGVGSVVYEALRVEVEPMSQRVGHMGTLVEQLTSVVRRLVHEVGGERRERIEDVRLMCELLVSSWESANRRLARIERILERLEEDRKRGSTNSIEP